MSCTHSVIYEGTAWFMLIVLKISNARLQPAFWSTTCTFRKWNVRRGYWRCWRRHSYSRQKCENDGVPWRWWDRWLIVLIHINCISVESSLSVLSRCVEKGTRVLELLYLLKFENTTYFFTEKLISARGATRRFLLMSQMKAHQISYRKNTSDNLRLRFFHVFSFIEEKYDD